MTRLYVECRLVVSLELLNTLAYSSEWWPAPVRLLVLGPSTLSRDNSVGVETRYGLEGPRIESRRGRDFPHLFRTALESTQSPISVLLNRRALASIIPGPKRPEETAICYKISLVQLITSLNIILYLSTCHTLYISVLILFMIMP